MASSAKIVYTFTDEAPALATYSFLPVIQSFCAAADVEVDTRDISLGAVGCAFFFLRFFFVVKCQFVMEVGVLLWAAVATGPPSRPARVERRRGLLLICACIRKGACGEDGEPFV